MFRSMISPSTYSQSAPSKVVCKYSSTEVITRGFTGTSIDRRSPDFPIARFRRFFLCRFRQPHLRHAQCVQRFDAHRPAFDLDRVTDPRAPPQAAEHVAADRRVRVLVDVQPELRVDVRHQREAVDVAGPVVAWSNSRGYRVELARDLPDDALHERLERDET